MSFFDTPVEKAKVGVVGVSYNAGDYGVGGSADAFKVLFDRLQYLETFDSKRGDLLDQKIALVGSVSATDFEGLRHALFEKINNVMECNPQMGLLFVGGDHTVTQVTADFLNSKRILWLDAHPDYYDEYEEDKFCQLTSARRLAEDGREVMMRGVRSVSKHEHDALTYDKVDVCKDLTSPGDVDYLSLDVDVLDPSLVGVSWPEAPGRSLSSVIKVIRETTFSHADLVEWVPDKGWPQVMTLFKELCWALLRE